MKVKAVIFRPDRTNDVVTVAKKKIAGKTFRHGDYQYVLDPDRFMVTWVKRLFFFRQYYNTYYYRQGTAAPLPVPDFEDITEIGVSSEEMAALWNPWFLRIIAQNGRDKYDQIVLYAAVGAALGVAYAVYLLTGIQSDMEMLRQAWESMNPAPPTGAP